MTVNEGARQDSSKSHQSDAKSGDAAEASWVDWVMSVNMTGPILLRLLHCLLQRQIDETRDWHPQRDTDCGRQ